MPDRDDTVGCGESTFDPIQVAQMGFYPHLAEAYAFRLYAQHVFTEPGGGSAGPAVAETVAKAHVAPGASVGMDVKLALRHHLVNAGGVFSIFIID